MQLSAEAIDAIEDTEESFPKFCCGYLFIFEYVRDSESLNARIVFWGAGIPTTSDSMAVELEDACGLKLTGGLVQSPLRKNLVSQIDEIVDTARVVALKPSELPSKMLPEGMMKDGKVKFEYTVSVRLCKIPERKSSC